MPELYSIILAGGSGTRFWPLSRELFPKQFMAVIDNRSLLRMTLERALTLAPADRTRVVTISSQYGEITSSAMELGLKKANIIEEPSARNTAAAIGMAVLDIGLSNPDAILAVFPSDHFIKNEQRFASIIRQASLAAAQDWIVTLGIEPTRPETGYGYILRGPRIEIPKIEKIFAAARFQEKPAPETATEYVRSGKYLWNSGMFIFRAGQFLSQLERYLPEHFEALKRINQITDKKNDRSRCEDIYGSIEKISVDKGIMENCERVAVIPADIGWSDVGSWKALYDMLEKHENGNVLHGDTQVWESRNNMLWSEGRLVAAIGIEDMAVIETPDAVLVCPLERSQDVRSLAGNLLNLGRKEALEHRRVMKPWGSYTVMSLEDNYQVKKLEIFPGQKMSLQSHARRSEHWTVVEGIATVTYESSLLDIPQGSDILIPSRTKHRIENRREGKLSVIEVQTGDYLGEDDIVRHEDDYGRALE